MSIISSSRECNTPGSSQKVVRFKLNYNLKSSLLRFANDKDSNLYEELLCHIRNVGQEIRDDDLTQLLKEARGCISIIDGNFRLFVQVVLILRWTHRSEEVIQEYQGFLQDLCSAHTYYTKVVLDHLTSSFKSDQYDWIDNSPSDKSIKCFNKLHQVIQSIIAVIPMSRELLLNSVNNNFPFVKKPAKEQQSYVYNVLQISQYEPSLHSELLSAIINKMVTLDVHLPKSGLECEGNNDTMEVDGVFPLDKVSPDSEPSVAESLDLCLLLLFKYLTLECHNEDGTLIWDKTKSLYSDLCKIFEDVILPTHATHHVQFLIFYFLSFKKPTLGSNFLQMLWKKVSNANVAPVIRQASVCYIASLLTRAKYISLLVVKDMVSEMANWLHSYVDNHDGSSSCFDHRVHSVFYTTCQALFYIIAFRHKDLVENKGLLHLQNLGLSKIVTCRLNPLRYCLPVVVSNFASIARSYQLAYCYTIIERNSRNVLPVEYRDTTGCISPFSPVHFDSFFPFDPYHLKKSKVYIDPIYREYCGPPETKVAANSSSSKEEDDDDFLDTTIEHQSARDVFSYGTSPGFLHV
ncbi:RNA polymerase I-specific transcription initiation factor RRN3 [Halyomorpha halys]|uniref:RNA polymerase I-specific transcription initiation factor RRN3 n=1 Tax=Halyomorpha halys TaxID=286706 RepID=UPI0006D52311|nr:RNA polymerase I-specific transcription initiation factor RRN3 [Halyomorpha halys]